MKKLFLTALLLFALLGCGERIRTGVVVAKVHVPRSTDIIMTPTTIGDFTYMIPTTVDNPERFVVRIQGKNSKGETAEDEWCLDAESWSRTQIGIEIQITN